MNQYLALTLTQITDDGGTTTQNLTITDPDVIVQVMRLTQTGGSTPDTDTQEPAELPPLPFNPAPNVISADAP